MRTEKHKVYGTIVPIEDMSVGDIIMVKRKINSKSVPYWPFKITSTAVRPDRGFPVIDGEFLLPGGNVAATAYVRARSNGDICVDCKPMPPGWVMAEQRKIRAELDELKDKMAWLVELDAELEILKNG